ncbi:MAG: 50S ribosomal protein L4 [Chloroflexi bacterium]|nr:50S ribosomal protein L4 [Chloroflexota bacterium]MQC17252.1 50S ribosomal protein L4 [Chloroflexota bacterium]
MKLQVIDFAGQPSQEIEVDESVFGIEPNEAVVHQTLLAQLAARRAGTANTKTRGQVAGSTRKIRRQKGLGMARQGGIRAPQHRGGGVVFGPSTRDYTQKLPKRMRRLAIRSVLSARAADGRLTVVENPSLATPSTKAITAMLEATGAGASSLIVTGTADRVVLKSASNIDGADVVPASTLNVADMLAHKSLVMTVDAVRQAEALWGGERAAGKPRPAFAAASDSSEGEA